MPVWPVADKHTLTNSLLLRKTQSTKIHLHKYSYLIILKFYGVGQNNGPFLGRGLPSIFCGHKKARISGHHPDSVLDGYKIPPFPGQYAMVIPDAWSVGNAAGKYAGLPLKASSAVHPNDPFGRQAPAWSLSSSNKSQCRDADADRRREDGPQRDKAGVQGASRGKYIVDKQNVPYTCLYGGRFKGSLDVTGFFFYSEFCLCSGAPDTP